MKRKLIRNKKVRFGTVSAILVIMVVVVAVLMNMVVSAVVDRYELNPSMIEPIAFDVTEDCYSFLDRVFELAKKEKRNTDVKILFCDVEEKVSAETATTYYTYSTAKELGARYSNITIECLDVFANPEPIKDYTTMKNPLTGEDIELQIYADSVIVVADGYHRVYGASEFFVYGEEDPTTAWAYSGEKKLAAAIMNALSKKERVAGFLNNHGEVFFDYEMINLLTDAGYTVLYFDLYKDPIPENCDLLISYNPNTDLLTKGENSDVSEMEILNDFLKKDGNSFLVFFGNGTPSLPNFEEFLSGWGVETKYDRNEKSGAAYRYMVQDPTGSLTTDGYTIYGDCINDTFATEDNPYVVFRNATALSVSGKGFRSNGEGGYVSTDGRRTVHPLYQSRSAAQSYANGKLVDSGATMLMSITEQNNGGKGASHVGVISSVQFATSRYLQSAVYGNADVLLHLLKELGGGMNTEGLTVKPFSVQNISTITTSEILTWTLCLSIIPAVLITGCAVVILVRRRRAR